MTAFQEALDTHDPDILACSTSEILPTLDEMATVDGVDARIVEPPEWTHGSACANDGVPRRRIPSSRPPTVRTGLPSQALLCNVTTSY